MLILVIVLVMVLGLGGGYYGYGRWGAGGDTGIESESDLWWPIRK